LLFLNSLLRDRSSRLVYYRLKMYSRSLNMSHDHLLMLEDRAKLSFTDN